MAKRLATRSWQAREALARREPYNTYGAMRAEEGGSWSAGRLPEPWRERYLNAYRDNRITYTVLSYHTPIAWVLDDGEVIVPDVKHSRTTTRHQDLLYALGRSSDQFAREAQEERQTARQRAAERRAERRERPTTVTSLPTRPTAVKAESAEPYDPYADRPSRNPVVALRPVPRSSGEAAIYSVEYLHKRESAYGTEPDRWRQLPVE
ncbi:hypothetical protein [Streptomyces halobius]|uniref:DUF8033 domain-containing protein n=1 Tax=Streptomyces halobius TaxID=2879846 RepID=A0ABY4M1M0_9ACTN|nr:hypothetical protein [Streptomyces halobius]UQA91654.1 hypothetical protein K9S39_07065 [Streptomyces halobius]